MSWLHCFEEQRQALIVLNFIADEKLLLRSIAGKSSLVGKADEKSAQPIREVAPDQQQMTLSQLKSARALGTGSSAGLGDNRHVFKHFLVVDGEER